MSRDEAELEAQRVAQVRMAITKLLEQKQGRRNLSLSEMERLVGEMDSDLRQAVMETLVEESQTQGQGLCPTCGGKVRHKGKRAQAGGDGAWRSGCRTRLLPVQRLWRGLFSP
jgi:hypothetical protein